MVARANFTIDRLARLGVVAVAGCRLRVARDLLLKLNNDELELAPEKSELIEQVTDAQKTIWEMFVIVNAALRRFGRSGSPFTSESLNTMLGGQLAPTLDKNPIARSTQFELLTAAWLTLGGTDVRKKEPDLELLYWGEYLGIAVKRIAGESAASAEGLVRDAASQISRSERPGFISLNVDAVYRGERRPSTEEGRVTLFTRKSDEVWQKAARRLGSRKAVKGVFMFGSVFEWSFERSPPQLDMSFPVLIVAIEDEDDTDARAKAAEFFSGLRSRVDAQIQILLS